MRYATVTATVLVCASLFGYAAGLDAQSRASDDDQIAIELVSAHFVRDSVKDWGVGDYAVDPRLYVRPIPIVGRGRIVSWPEITPTSEAYSRHTPLHLNTIAEIFGLSTVLVDDDLCTPISADLCRLGDHKGLITFSAAWIDTDGSARVIVSFWERSTRTISATGETFPVVAVRQEILTLVRTRAGWAVRDRTTTIT